MTILFTHTVTASPAASSTTIPIPQAQYSQPLPLIQYNADFGHHWLAVCCPYTPLPFSSPTLPTLCIVQPLHAALPAHESCKGCGGHLHCQTNHRRQTNHPRQTSNGSTAGLPASCMHSVVITYLPHCCLTLWLFRFLSG